MFGIYINVSALIKIVAKITPCNLTSDRYLFEWTYTNLLNKGLAIAVH